MSHGRPFETLGSEVVPDRGSRDSPGLLHEGSQPDSLRFDVPKLVLEPQGETESSGNVSLLEEIMNSCLFEMAVSQRHGLPGGCLLLFCLSTPWSKREPKSLSWSVVGKLRQIAYFCK